MNSEIEQKIKLAHTVESLQDAAISNEFESIWAAFNFYLGKNPDKTFLSYYDDDKKTISYSYYQFSEKVNQICDLFRSLGIAEGDRIVTAGYNHPDIVLTYFSCWKMGLCVVPLNMGEDDHRLKYILSNSNPKLIIALEKEYIKIQNLDPSLKVIKNSILHESKERIKAVEKTENLLQTEALLIYTSGTTGNPKGVLLTQFNLLSDAKSIRDWFGITQKDVMMCVLPLHHVNGTVVTHITPLLSGSSVILQKKFSAHHFFKIAEKENVTISSVVPTLLQFLLQSKTSAGNTKLKFLICGAGPLTVELVLKFEEQFNIPVMHGYGLSETTCYSCFLPPDLPLAEHKGWLSDFGFPSIGVPIPSNEMEIHDDHGEALSENEKGEIVIRGLNVMKGYFDNDEANLKAFEFGWFRSGDEGFYKHDQVGRKFFFITGRFKELIIRGGINLSPLEIDEVINRCPGVKTGISVAFENDWYGEEVGAFVQKENADLNEMDVIKFCSKHLPFMKQPKIVIFGEQIPVTTTGKYQRNKIKHLFLGWKAVQFKETKTEVER